MVKTVKKKGENIFDNLVLPSDEQIKQETRNKKQALAISGNFNPMKGKVSPNNGKLMPQISEKIKGKKKPEGFGEKISQRRKELGLGNTWGGKQRPEHSNLMKDPTRNKGAEATRTPWICEHCGKDGIGLTNYARWHGDNCKYATN